MRALCKVLLSKMRSCQLYAACCSVHIATLPHGWHLALQVGNALHGLNAMSAWYRRLV